MPLSEQEQRALQALEQGLYQQDPDFAQRVRKQSVTLHGRLRLTLSILGFVGGLALMLGFCLTTVVAIGVAGFLVMFASLYTLWISASRLRRARMADPTRTEGSGRAWPPWRRP